MQRNSMVFILGVAGVLSANLISSEWAVALDLTAPMAVETAQVLPAGVRNPRFMNVFMSMGTKFNGAGQSEALGNPLNRNVKWSDVLGIQNNETEKSIIKSTLRDMQLNPTGSPGSTTGEVNTSFNIKVPVLAMGITDRWTLAVAVPIVNISVSADTGFVASSDGQKFFNRLCALSVDQCNTAARKMNNSVNEKLTAYGYQPIQSKTISGIGDIQLVNKYNAYQDTGNGLTVKSVVTLPTGIKANSDAALDIPTGDGRLGLGATLIYDRYLGSDFKWNAFGGWMALLPNTMEKRIPTGQDDPISSDKETLTRKLGNQFSLGTSISHQFVTTGITAAAGYNFQFLTKQTYSNGAKFTQERYRYLEDLTPSEVLHSTTLMAGFSTVEWYQNKKFFYPFQANVIFSRPLKGRNVTTNDVLTGELVLFF